MSFASQITTAPIPFQPDQAMDVLTDLPSLPPQMTALIKGSAGCSPYLAGLMRKEATWLEALPDSDPDDVMATILAATDAPLKDLPVVLRRAKGQVALLTALADLGGVWGLDQITGALTQFADTAIQRGAAALIQAEAARGKLPAADAPFHGYCVLAMGKMGAGELNYSSDIDLICLFDETRFDPDDWAEARAGFVRVTRRLAGMLGDQTADGYVFRTDLRLRPDSGVTPVAMAMAAAERYYESLGRTWERAAHIKARVSAGDAEAGQAYLTRLQPFVWRRHLDFSAIRDVHDMAEKIRQHRGLGGKLELGDHNVKLGLGGIREIEFFAQTLQLIFGGRDKTLRVAGTVPALKQLAQAGRISDETATRLQADYVALRTLEHRLQMVADQQTHVLPKSEEGLERIARFMGAEDVAAWKHDTRALFERVHGLTEPFLARKSEPDPAEDMPDADLVEATARWSTFPALRSARATESFARIRGRVLSGLSKAANPQAALTSFESFLAGLPAGAQLFALFEANPHLVDLVVDIASVAPRLAQYLSRNAGVFDAVIAGEFFGPWPGVQALQQGLQDAVDGAQDYEEALDVARLWQKDWHFRVGVHHLRGLIQADEAGGQYADVAEACLAVLYPTVARDFAAKHGDAPGRGAVVLGMGSLGAGWLNAGSDLDLIVVYDAAGVESSDGKRPLVSRLYYARLTQALVTALTAPTAAGRLYEVDLRLRPSGRKGPVATSLQSFGPYQRDEAWTWEHLALTRARVLAGPDDLGLEVEAERCAILKDVGRRAGISNDVNEMRTRLQAEKPAASIWDAKNGAGRIMDISLAAQTLALKAGTQTRSVVDQLASVKLPRDQTNTLNAAFKTWLAVLAVTRLVSDGQFDPHASGAGAAAFLLRETGARTMDDLEKTLDQMACSSSQIIDRILSE